MVSLSHPQTEREPRSSTSSATDVFLTSDGELDHAVQLLLGSRFYTAHSDRMVANIMDLVETVRLASMSKPVILLMLCLLVSNSGNRRNRPTPLPNCISYFELFSAMGETSHTSSSFYGNPD